MPGRGDSKVRRRWAQAQNAPVPIFGHAILDIRMPGDSLEEGCQREFLPGEQADGREDGILYHLL